MEVKITGCGGTSSWREGLNTVTNEHEFNEYDTDRLSANSD